MSQTTGKLERRTRALLRVYPADYRHGRAEEIIGTLLEAAPADRPWPTARETWSLIAGGRHARAARNRRPGVKANLRLALLLCISTYLSFNAVMGLLPGHGVSWHEHTMSALTLVLALGPWLGRGRAAAAGLAIPAGALVAYENLRGTHGSFTTMWLAEFLVVIAALAALSGGPVRLPRSWLLLPCAFPLAPVAELLLSPGHFRGYVLESSLLLVTLSLLTAIVVCWLVTDARPAFALCLAALLFAASNTLPELITGDSMFTIAVLKAFLVQFAIVLPILLPAGWLLLRRQKTPGPLPEP